MLIDPTPSPRLRRPAEDRLQELTAGRYNDPQTGDPISIGTRSLVLADSITGDEAEMVRSLGFGNKLAVISDPATAAVLGHQIERALAGSFQVQSLQLPANPYPNDATVELLRGASRQADAFIAVGSGTINDLTKYVSALEQKPYAVFATAPSMNGYVSVTASITVHGHKSTLPAQAPTGAFFDLGVLAAAPKRMIRAGLGDSICRTTAQADWLLSHLLIGSEYRSLPFDLLSEDEPLLLAHTAGLLNGDLEAMRILTRTLLLSGFGTAIVGSSAPASQAEHLISHYIDMMAPATRPAILHGEQIAVTTLSSARLQHALLTGKTPVVVPDATSDADVVARFGKELAPSVLKEFDRKRLDRVKAEALNDRLSSDWDTIREQVLDVLLPLETIQETLWIAGAPLTAHDISVDSSLYKDALMHSREIRNRYTVLDLAAQSGELEILLSTL